MVLFPAGNRALRGWAVTAKVEGTGDGQVSAAVAEGKSLLGGHWVPMRAKEAEQGQRQGRETNRKERYAHRRDTMFLCLNKIYAEIGVFKFFHSS